jgi:curved DNA-binding protein CbpA
MKILLTEHQFKILAEKLILEAAEPWKQKDSGMDIDYYEKLGIDKSATKDQIKKAYRKLALKTHPDNNPDNREAAEIEFQKINSINQILNDDKLRKKYDEWYDIVLPLIKQQRQQQQQQPKQEPKQEPPKPKQEPKQQQPKQEPKQEPKQQQKQNAKKTDTAIYTSDGSKGSQKGTSVYTGGSSKGSQQNTSSNSSTTSGGGTGNTGGNNQQGTSSGSGTGGGGTGNTGGNNQQGTSNTNNSNTAKKVKKSILDDDTLAKAYYEAPNLFDIFINLISGREAFEGKGYIKIIDLINDKVTFVKKILPNLFKYFNFNKDIEFEVLEKITFKSTPQYSFVPNKIYKMKMKKSNDINKNIILTSIDNNKIKIKLIEEDINWVDNIILVKGYYSDIVNKQKIKINSEPKLFKIKLNSKKDTGYYNSEK